MQTKDATANGRSFCVAHRFLCCLLDCLCDLLLLLVLLCCCCHIILISNNGEAAHTPQAALAPGAHKRAHETTRHRGC